MFDTIITLWNAGDYLNAIALVVLITHGLCSAIVKLTPTPKDDAIYASFYEIVSKIALNKPDAPK